MLAEHGIVVTYDTIHQWCQMFGQAYANELRRRRQVTSGRCVLENQRQNTVPLAGRRSSSERASHPLVPSPQSGGQEVLAQAP